MRDATGARDLLAPRAARPPYGLEDAFHDAQLDERNPAEDEGTDAHRDPQEELGRDLVEHLAKRREPARARSEHGAST